MPQFLVAIHHPDNYDPRASEDKAMREAIDALNDEMVSAGIRVFVGGLQPVGSAKSLTALPDGGVQVSDGPYLRSNEHVGGFWVLRTDTFEEALEWGRKAVIACRAPVEVRPFFGP